MSLRQTSRIGCALAVAALALAATSGVGRAASGEQDPRGQVRDYWAKALTKCAGDYYRYAPYGDEAPAGSASQLKVFEYQGVGFQLDAKRVSKDDRAEGIDWRGVARVTWKVWRFRDPKHLEWSDWYNAGDLRREVEVMRKNGVVLVKPEDGTGFTAVGDVAELHQACPAE